MVNGYTEAVTKLEAEMKEFVVEATAGADGHGSKTSAMKARKLSGVITKSLKDFRKISIENDRAKTKVAKTK